MSYFTLSQGHLVGWIAVLTGLILGPRALCLTPLTRTVFALNLLHT